MPSSPPPFPETDCDRPACDDIQDALKMAQTRLENNNKSEKNDGKKSSNKSKNKTKEAGTATSCPPRSAELGRSSWTLLHSMGAWYPDAPTPQQQDRMKNFMEALGDFYPCPWCADDFQKEMNKTPPAVETRSDLCLWLCDQHNRVNKKLGKPLFDCTMKKLDERWRKSSDPKCTGESG